MAKKIYKIDGMHCTSCAMVIESDLEDAGVKATCSYAKQTLEVEDTATTIDDGQIERIVKNAGYTLVVPT